MKKVVFIAICILSTLYLSSCRSSSKSCGLAEHTTTIQQTTLQQADNS